MTSSRWIYLHQLASSKKAWKRTHGDVFLKTSSCGCYQSAIVGLGLWFCDIDAPVALATISGALAFVPYFGSIVAIFVGAMAALPQGLSSALLTSGIIGAASFIEGYLITPYLQSEALVLPPVVLLFFMLAFGTLFGVLGVVLAVPATVVLVSGFELLREKRS